MEAGDLNLRVALEIATVTRDTYGAEILTWRNLATVWASKEHKTSRKFYAAQKINAEITDLFTIRYRAGMTTRLRVTYDGKTYNIIGSDDPDGKRVSMQLFCRVVT